MDMHTLKRINEFILYTDSQKGYILAHTYFEKIKDYFEKEYGGQVLSDPIIFKEWCFTDEGIEEYKSELGLHIQYKQECFPFEGSISFHINYEYSIKRSSGLWESFRAYRYSDEVYLQGTGDGTFPKEFREEYNRSWQNSNVRRIPTYPDWE